MKNNHKLTSLKMVRKSPKMGDSAEKRDLWNILGFIFFIATVCIVATFTMRSHVAQHSILRRSALQMGKLFFLSETAIF